MRRSGFRVMISLIGLIKPLFAVMLLAIFTGVLGHLVAIFITILAGYGYINFLGIENYNLTLVIVLLIAFGILRGIFRYIEQISNHFIAFKLLALIRHKIFTKLRALTPAKLEGRDKGNLISIITGDIELLEVFYAHTISPIAIATIVSIVMTIFIGYIDTYSGFLALLGYIIVGVVLPVIFSKLGNAKGQELRDEYGDMNGYFLENIQGIQQVLQFGMADKRAKAVSEKTKSLETRQKHLKKLQGINSGLTACTVIAFGAIMFIQTYLRGLDFTSVIIATIAMMGSFGPVIALSALSGNLYHTIACGNRVLNLLSEEPIVDEIKDGENIEFNGGELENISFSYKDEQVIKDFTLSLPKSGVIGLKGKSGCGKSTVLKLIMRFWKTNSGDIKLSSKSVDNINTASLRKNISYVTQETVIFNDTIANNIAVAKAGATVDEIREAAKKASIDEFIMSLPQGYDTVAGELGETLSGGERQRIGLARAFLHDAPLMLLDEPTSNIDSLNEGIILKSIIENKADKLVVLVSHRGSTMGACDKVIEFNKVNNL